MARKRFNLADVQSDMARRGEFITESMTTTKSEDVMGKLLIDAGLKVTPQFEVDGRSFDFRILDYPILIEVDGGVHATIEKRLSDYRKDRYVMRRGWKVFRYANMEVHGKKNWIIPKEIKNMMQHMNACPKVTLIIRQSFWGWFTSGIKTIFRFGRKKRNSK